MVNKKIAVIVSALLLSTNVLADTGEKVDTEYKYSKDSKGIQETLETERINDPKGTGNKTWSKEAVKAKLDNDGTFQQKSTRESVDQVGTSRKIDEKIDQKIKDDGMVQTNSEKIIVSDPKGLNNKTKSVIERTIEEQPDGSTVSTKKIDGKLVETSVR